MPPDGGTLLGTRGSESSTVGERSGTNAPNKTRQDRVCKDVSSSPQTVGRRAWKWDKNRLSALADHLDLCQTGRVTWAVFQKGLQECDRERVINPDARKLAAVSRFEVALYDLGFDDVDEAIRTLASGERGGAELVEIFRRIGDGNVEVAREVDVDVREERGYKPLTVREGLRM